MPAMVFQFGLIGSLMVLATAAGYLVRRLRYLPQRAGEIIMTVVAVFGFPAVSFLSVWGTRLEPGDILLPAMAVAHVLVMLPLSLVVSRWASKDRSERGLFILAGVLGNNGFTMGAFVLYLLYGEQGMGLGNLYLLFFIPLVVVLIYPMARHYSTASPSLPMGRLMWRSVLDWRSIGLPATASAMVLSLLGVPRPWAVAQWHVVDILIYVITPLAFFSIGLRLHFSRVLPLWRMLAALAVVRFFLGAAAGVGLAWLMPWPAGDLRWNVFVIEAFVPTAVIGVAVAGMFDLRPREASGLFVCNTLTYLVAVLPLVLWIFG